MFFLGVFFTIFPLLLPSLSLFLTHWWWPGTSTVRVEEVQSGDTWIPSGLRKVNNGRRRRHSLLCCGWIIQATSSSQARTHEPIPRWCEALYAVHVQPVQPIGNLVILAIFFPSSTHYVHRETIKHQQTLKDKWLNSEPLLGEIIGHSLSLNDSLLSSQPLCHSVRISLQMH